MFSTHYGMLKSCNIPTSTPEERHLKLLLPLEQRKQMTKWKEEEWEGKTGRKATKMRTRGTLLIST